MTTMLTTLEGEETLEGDFFIADNKKVYSGNSLNGYSELGSVDEIYNLKYNELFGNPDFEEILNGDELEGEQGEDLYIHQNGKVYYKSPLGGYSEIGTTEEVLGCGQNELSGNSNLEEILYGDELGKGFKFKAPKMKFKAPKMKFKAPRINTKGISRGLSNVGKGISKGVKAYGKAWSNVGKGIGKAVSNIARGAGQIAESLLDQQEQSEQQEEENSEQENEQATPEEELDEVIDNVNDQSTEENINELEGIHTDSNGKVFYYSELNGEYVELGSDELGFMSMISNIASGGGGGKSGMLSMATGALDMAIPGAGTVANIGINAAQKQRQKAKAKKKKNSALRKNLLRHYQNKKDNPQNFIKQTKPIPTQKPVIQNKQISLPTKEQTQIAKTSLSPIQTTQRSFSSQSRPMPGAETGVMENETSQTSDVQKDKKNEIMFGVLAALGVIITVIYSKSKKGRK